MNDIIISGIHLELTEALKAKVQEKAQKLFEHGNNVIRMRMELIGREHNVFTAKGHLEVKGDPFIVSEDNTNLYKAIDLVVEKLDRKLRRRHRLDKTKRKHLHGVDVPSELPKTNAN